MAADRAANAPRPLARLALGLFSVLLAFGLLMLFLPDLASDLDRRSSGGEEATGEAVAVTETKRTTEETTRSSRDTSAEKRSTRAANKPGGRQGGGGGKSKRDARTTQTSRRDKTTTTTTTETTTTETVTPTDAEESWIAGVFAVPAVAVLLRLATVALLAALAALPLLWAMRRAAADDRPNHPAPAVAPSPVPPSAPAPPSVRANPPVSQDNPPKLPAKPLVTRVDAERAKASVIDGIPLLREIFEERGEPVIANTLPDMRVRVKLTDTIMKEQPLPVSVLAEDPALALGTFRTEVEQRLRRLARDAVAQSADSIDEILRGLADEGLFEPEAADGLRNLLKMSERAARGARVDPAMGAWVREEGVTLLLSLDLMLPS